LGEPTGIDLKAEMSGLVPTAAWKLRKKKELWQAGETLCVSIGQGFLLVTPIQLLGLISAVANGGKIYRPQIVDRIETGEGRVVKKFYPIEEREVPISKETIQVIKDGLGGAVNEPHATGWRAKIRGIEVAGKTGTAQVVRIKRDDEKIDEDEVPYQERDHAWFVAFAPKEEAKIAVVVLVEHGGHGGELAAPIAREIIERYLKTEKEVHD
jgi:penicillin-binding protein 2